MRKQLDFYGYCSPTSGIYRINDVEYFYGEDYRSVKRYKEYKNVGFNMLLLQHENSYSGEEWETSACRKCMTEGYKAGLKRIIVSDSRLKDLCVEKNLLGEEGKFKTQKELDDYIDFCTKPYRNQKGFYGVQLYDEPWGHQLESYGIVMKTIRRLFPDMYMQSNLLPLAGKEWLAAEARDSFEAYDIYLRKYVKECEPDNILFDEYPFRRNYLLGGYTMRTYQAVADICREYGLEMRSVLQSFSFVSNQNLIHRRVLKPDMLWQTNMAMGFGVREISFFTYFTKPNTKLKEKLDTDGIDGASFINRDGTRTKLYYYTKKIIARMRKFAPVLLKYEYVNNYFAFEEGKTYLDFPHTEFAKINENCPVKVNISYGVSLVCEQKGKDGKLYVVENLGNLKDELDGKAPAQIRIELPKGEKVKRVYLNGKRVSVKCKDGVIQTPLAVGDAYFIEVK